MIQIDNSIPESDKAELFGPDDVKIGDVENAYAFCRVRLDIRRGKLQGYYFKRGGEKIPISQSGRIESWPSDFFDFWSSQTRQLFVPL